MTTKTCATTYATVVISHDTRHADGSPIIERTCGHQHRTISGVELCHRRLTRRQPDGMFRADFYHGAIRHADEGALTDAEAETLLAIQSSR
jgi:hypothetical protein